MKTIQQQVGGARFFSLKIHVLLLFAAVVAYLLAAVDRALERANASRGGGACILT